jgi:putative ABC transport system permease protein
MAKVAVISAALSRRYWANDNPLGQRIVLVGTDTPVTIVGVVGDVRQPISEDPRAESVLYVSYEQFPWPFMTVFFLPSADTAAAVAAVRQEIVRIDSSQAAGPVQKLDDVRTQWLSQPRLQTTVVWVFGLATFFLTVIGLYARVANAVTNRSREFAIRQALGARPADVVRRLTLEAVLVTTSGVVAGLCVLPLSSRALRSLVVDAPLLDLRAGSASAGLLIASAWLAAYWPARRAGRIDPAQILKAD